MGRDVPALSRPVPGFSNDRFVFQLMPTVSPRRHNYVTMDKDLLPGTWGGGIFTVLLYLYLACVLPDFAIHNTYPPGHRNKAR